MIAEQRYSKIALQLATNNVLHKSVDEYRVDPTPFVFG